MNNNNRPRRNFLRKVWNQSKGTMYIIALFMLVTMGLPLILPSVSHQVLFYAGLALVLAYDIGKN